MSTLYPLSHKVSPAASRPESPDLSQLSATTSVPIVSRPLSPTPSETLLLAHRGLNGPLNWKTIKASIRLRNIPYILFAAIWILVLILTIALDKKIARALEPAGRTLRGLAAGWLIPVAILLVISFPPLLGHEIVAVFVGLIWGIGPGFGILAFGTLLGEIMNFYLFRYVFRNRAANYERKNIKYGLLAHVVREGGFWLALMVRLSVIPSHLTTTVFALSGMSSVTYIFAALLSLPKHIVGVAVGSMAHESNTNSTEESHSKIITGVSIGVTAIVTLYSIWYTTRKIEAGKPEFIRMKQEARQAAADAEAEAEAISAELPDQDLRSIASSDPVIPAPVELPVAKSSSHLYPPTLRVPHSYPPSP